MASYLYGSHVRDQATILSNLDLGLLLRDQGDQRLRLEARVGGAINAAMGTGDADIRVLNDAPLVFEGRALTDGHLIYCTDDEALVRFECRARAEYFDILPALDTNATSRRKAVARNGLHG